MPQVSAAEFSRLAGVSKVAVSKLVNAVPPRLIVVNGKLDTENPVNADYLASPHGRLSLPKPKAPAKKSARKKTPEPDDAELTKAVLAAQAKREKKATGGEPDADEDGIDELKADLEALMKDGGKTGLIIRKMKADVAYKEESADKLALDKEERKKNLIRRDGVVSKIQAINKAIDDHVNRQHAKTGPSIFALARKDGGTELEVIRRLELDYGAAIRKAIEEITRVAN